MLPSYSWKSDVKNKLLLESKDAKRCSLTAPYILIPADPSKIQAFSQSFQDQYTFPGHGAQLLVCKTQRQKRLFCKFQTLHVLGDLKRAIHTTAQHAKLRGEEPTGAPKGPHLVRRPSQPQQQKSTPRSTFTSFGHTSVPKNVTRCLFHFKADGFSSSREAHPRREAEQRCPSVHGRRVSGDRV